MIKRLILLVLSVFSCLTVLGGCAARNTEETVVKYDEKVVVNAGHFFAMSWAEGSLEGLVEEQLNNSTKRVLIPMIKNLDAVKESTGAFKSAGATGHNIIAGEDYVKYEEMLEFEKGVVKFTAIFDEDSIDNGYIPSSIAAELQITMAKKLEKAALNTVFGMGFIFLVLIFISLVIKALSVVPKLFSRKEEVAANTVQEAQTTVVENTAPVKDMSSEELTAVITAAIMAYTAEHKEVCADGLVVRSISRKGGGAWRKA